MSDKLDHYMWSRYYEAFLCSIAFEKKYNTTFEEAFIFYKRKWVRKN